MSSELTVQSETCASILKVLADETRLAVVEQLLKGPKVVGEINESLGIEQSLLSHHLRVLREAGLVKTERQGKQMRYSIVENIQGRSQGKAINLGCCKISFK